MKNPISIQEICKILNINKSTVHFYIKIGLIVPTATVSNMYVFDKNEIIPKLKKIEKFHKQGKTLKEIKKKFKK